MIRPQFGSVSTPSFGAPRGTVQSVTGHTGCAAGGRFETHGDLNGARSKLFSDREDRQAGTKIQMYFMRRANYGTRLAAIARARGLSNCNQLQSVNRGTPAPEDPGTLCFVLFPRRPTGSPPGTLVLFGRCVFRWPVRAQARRHRPRPANARSHSSPRVIGPRTSFSSPKRQNSSKFWARVSRVMIAPRPTYLSGRLGSRHATP